MKGIEPPTPSLPWTCSTPELHRRCVVFVNFKFLPMEKSKMNKVKSGKLPTIGKQPNFRAGDETRTHDPQLGRLMLYQLSYARKRINLC